MRNITGIQTENWPLILGLLILHRNKRVFRRNFYIGYLVRSCIMSFISIAFPLEAAASFAGVAAGAARPLLGVSLFATLLLVFKPLLKGLLQAAILMMAPRKSLEERRFAARLRGVSMLHRMAREYDRSQPNLAAELRQIASRG
jgi:hypothetical protein